MPVEGGPYLSAAFFCDRVLREQEGTLSAIRIIDRWNIVGVTEQMELNIVRATLLVLFRSGIHRGAAQVIITPISPSNTRMPQINAPLSFEGDDDRGAGIVLPIGFPVQEAGTYWFEIQLTGVG